MKKCDVNFSIDEDTKLEVDILTEEVIRMIGTRPSPNPNTGGRRSAVIRLAINRLYADVTKNPAILLDAL